MMMMMMIPEMYFRQEETITKVSALYNLQEETLEPMPGEILGKVG